MKTAQPAADSATTSRERRVHAMAPAARNRHTGHAYRRRAASLPLAAEVTAASALTAFLDEHAVKAGMVMFYVWFVVANWSRLMDVGKSAAFHVLGLG